MLVTATVPSGAGWLSVDPKFTWVDHYAIAETNSEIYYHDGNREREKEREKEREREREREREGPREALKERPWERHG